MAKISNNQAQAILFEVDAIAQKKQVVPQRKKGVTLYEYPLQPLEERGLSGCWKNFGEFIKNGRGNKTII